MCLCHSAGRHVLSKNLSKSLTKEENLFNIISFGKRKENLLLALQQKVIGSTLTTFKEKIEPGATVFLHCAGRIWATAQVKESYFFSEEVLWKDKLYPHRYKIHKCKLLASPVELSDGTINLEFRKVSGPSWAYRYLFSPKEIPKEIAKLISDKIEPIKGISYEEFEELFLKSV